jgi:hypothetical protein
MNTSTVSDDPQACMQSKFDEKRAWHAGAYRIYVKVRSSISRSMQVRPTGTNFRPEIALVETKYAAKFDRCRLKGKNSTLESILLFTGYRPIYSTVVETELPPRILGFLSPARKLLERFE